MVSLACFSGRDAWYAVSEWSHREMLAWRRPRSITTSRKLLKHELQDVPQVGRRDRDEMHY